jgi:hypothetical protein
MLLHASASVVAARRPAPAAPRRAAASRSVGVARRAAALLPLRSAMLKSDSPASFEVCDVAEAMEECSALEGAAQQARARRCVRASEGSAAR